MEKAKNHQLRLGILILAGLLFFIVSVYLLGKQQNLFSSGIEVNAHFEDVKGLQIGNSVRFFGIDVGTVTDIRILNDSVIEVEMGIDKDDFKFIKKDAKVEISNEGLMGNKLIKITPGSTNSPNLENGDELLSKNTITSDDLLEETRKIVQSTKKVADNLIEVTEKMNNGNGDFSKLLNDNKITSNLEKVSSEMVNLSSGLQDITHKINNGNGDLGILLNEDEISRKTGDIIKKLDSIAATGKKTMDNFHETSRQINEGDGIINKLIYDTILPNELDTTMIKLDDGIDEATQAASTIENSWILNVFSKKNKKQNK